MKVPDQNITESLVVFQEIIDCKEAKEREEQKELLHSIFRHDLLNKTNIIQGYLELLKDTELSRNKKNTSRRPRKPLEPVLNSSKK